LFIPNNPPQGALAIDAFIEHRSSVCSTETHKEAQGSGTFAALTRHLAVLNPVVFIQWANGLFGDV